MNRQYIESQIEYEISKFSNIDYKLANWDVIENDDNTISLININIRNIKEVYILDKNTFEVLDQVE